MLKFIHPKGALDTVAALYFYYHSAIKFPSSIYEPILYQNSIWISATLFWHAEKRACAFSFSTPNNIQSWPQKHKFFFLLFPLKQEKQLENVVSESLVMSVPMWFWHFLVGTKTTPTPEKKFGTFSLPPEGTYLDYHIDYFWYSFYSDRKGLSNERSSVVLSQVFLIGFEVW